MPEDRDALVEADAIIKRELNWVLNVEPAVAHMSSNRKIDRRFGVVPEVISSIYLGKSWTHLESAHEKK